LEDGPCTLFDNLHDAACPRFDQNGATVHHGVSVLPHTVFRRDFIISDTLFRENGADPYILTILIGWASLFDDIGAEAGTLVYPKDPRYTAHDAAHDAAYNRPNRASRSLTIPCPSLNSAGDTLGLAYNWKKHCSHNSSSADKTANHDDSLLGDIDKKTTG
jgi:hypothetical protein